MILKSMLYTVLIGGMLIVLAILLMLGPVRIVVSDSMAPAIRAGDTLLIRPFSGVIMPGMVVSYDLRGKLVTHRVVTVEGDHIVTKGDNNQEVDPWKVPISSVVGTPVVRIPYVGYAIEFIKTPFGWLFFVIIPASWIIFSEAKKIITKMHKSKVPES